MSGLGDLDPGVAGDDELAAVEAVLDGATVWGAELDTEYRVLGVTVEITPDGHPDGADAEDRRVLLMLHPVGSIRALLRRYPDEQPGPVVVEKFDVEQLVDVVDRLGGARLSPPVFNGGWPDLTEEAPELSLEGASQALDGGGHRARLTVESDDRRLDLEVTFDAVRLNRPDGTELPLG